MSQSKPQSIILIDQKIGDPSDPIHVYADLEYLSEDIGDYSAKLRFARGIPTNPQAITMDDAHIDEIASQLSMPESTRREQDAKNARIYEELVRYYEKQNRTIEVEATMLAITMNNEWSFDPKPYESAPAPRKRPGLITISEPPRKVETDEVERRLKQLTDKLSDTPEAFSQFMEAVEKMSIDARRRLTARDNDGFQSGAADTSVPSGIEPVDAGSDQKDS